MTHLVSQGIAELSDDRVGLRDAFRRSFLGHALEDIVQIFVTNRHGCLHVPCVGHPTASRKNGYVMGQLEYSKKFLRFLEPLALLYQIVDLLLLRVFRRIDLDFNALRTNILGGKQGRHRERGKHYAKTQWRAYQFHSVLSCGL
jgi:hypothetical protein